MRPVLLCLLWAWGTVAAIASGSDNPPPDSLCKLSVTGRVVDQESGEPLPYAQLALDSPRAVARTDANGWYAFKGVCPGEHIIRVSHFGSEPQQVVFRIEGDTSLTLPMPHWIGVREGVLIVADHDHDNALGPHKAIDAAAIRAASGGNLADVLERTAGLPSLRTGQTIAKPAIQGMFGNRVAIFNNGVRLESQSWGNEHAPEIDPFGDKNISIVKGPGAVAYASDAMGGAILVEDKPLRRTPGADGTLMSGFYTNGRGLYGNGTLNTFLPLKDNGIGLRANASGRRAGNIHAPGYYLNNTGVAEYGLSGSANYVAKNTSFKVYGSRYATQLGILGAAHISNLTDLQNAIGRERPLGADSFTYAIGRPMQHVSHSLNTFEVRHQWSAKFGQRLVLGYQFDDRSEYDAHSPGGGIAHQRPQLQFRLESHTARLENTYHTDSGWHLHFGADGLRQTNVTRGFFFMPNFRMLQTGTWFSAHREWGRTGVDLGARADVCDLEVYRFSGSRPFAEHFTFVGGSASALVSYRQAEWLRWYAQVATGWRPPGVNELYSDGVHHGTASIEKGDAALRPEKMGQVSGGFRAHRHTRYGLNGNLWHKEVTDFIFMAPASQPELTVRGAFPAFQYQQARAYLQGTEAKAWHALPCGLTLNVQAWLLRGINRETGTAIPWVPSSRYAASLQWRQERAGRLLHPVAEVQWMHVAQKQGIAPHDDYLAPPPSYGLLNAHLGATLRTGRQNMTFQLAGQNLLNTRYRDYMDRFRYFSDAMGRNINFKIIYSF